MAKYSREHGVGMTVTIHQKAADLIDKAADLIEERGWTRRTFEDDGGRLCAVGALNTADIGQARREDVVWTEECIVAVRSLEDELSRLRKTYGVDVPSNISLTGYNDFIAKDERHIIRLFRRVARNLRA